MTDSVATAGPGLDLGAWLDTTRELAAAAGMPAAPAELTAVAAHAGRATVRIAVCGELVRPRHALVNDLAGRPVLPKHTDPGGSVPVLVTAGGDEHLEALVDGRVERAPLPIVDWPVAARSVSVSVASEPLARLGLDLVSVGLVDLTGELTAPDRLAVHGADAVVVVVSATAAMTMAETAFIEQCLGRARMPRVLLVVANLDLVEPDEQQAVLDYVHRRAAAVSPALAVLPADEGEIRAWTERVVAEMARQRPRQLAGQLAECLRRVVEAAGVAGQEAGHEAGRRADERDAAERTVSDELYVFDGLKTELQGLRNRAVDEFRAESQRYRRQLGNGLQHDLQRVADPRQWWTEELPHRLEVNLTDWSRRTQTVLHAQIDRNTAWLDGELVKLFDLHVQRPPELSGPELATPGRPATELADLRSRKLLYRLGPSGLALVAIIAIPPVAPIAAICASMIGTGLAELRLRGLIDEQRATILAHLPRMVDGVLDDYGAAVTEQIDLVYRHLQDEVSRLRQVWKRRRDDELRRDDPGFTGEGVWRELATRAGALAATIETAITDTAVAETAATDTASAPTQQEDEQ